MAYNDNDKGDDDKTTPPNTLVYFQQLKKPECTHEQLIKDGLLDPVPAPSQSDEDELLSDAEILEKYRNKDTPEQIEASQQAFEKRIQRRTIS